MILNDLMPYVPPILSIFFLLIGGLTRGPLTSALQGYLTGRLKEPDPTKASEQINWVRDLALDWTARNGFYASMFAALFSALSIFSASQNYVALVITLLVLLVIFIPMSLWIQARDAGGLETTKRFFGKTDSWSCQVVLIVVYVLLGVAIFVSQRLPAAATYHPGG